MVKSSPYKLITFFFIIAVLLPAHIFSQVMSANIGIDGLHCSACSYGTERSLRQLDFIQDIKMDLNKHIAEITFKPDKEIQLDMLAKKVTDAGFSVRSIYIVFNFNAVSVKEKYCYEYANMVFNFIGIPEKTLQGPVGLHLIGKDYMPKSEFKKWKLSPAPSCENPVISLKKIYYVTI